MTDTQMYQVRILVDDFPACFRFYRDVLGMHPVQGDSCGPYASLVSDGGLRLGLLERALMAEAVPGARVADRAGGDAAILVFRVHDVDQTRQRLAGRGVRFESEPSDYPAWAIRAAHLRDPDGRLVELFSAPAVRRSSPAVHAAGPSRDPMGD